MIQALLIRWAGEKVGKLLADLLPLAIIGALTVALMLTRGTLRDVRMQNRLDAAQAETAAANQRAAFAVQGQQAAEKYAADLKNQAPVIVRATDTVREYAKTSAGSAVCAPADRVHGTDLLDQQLFGPTTPEGGN